MLNRSQAPQVGAQKKFQLPPLDLQPIHENLQLLTLKDPATKCIQLTFMVERGLPKNHEDYVLADLLMLALVGTTEKATKAELQSLLTNSSINLMPFSDCDRLIFVIQSFDPDRFLEALPKLVALFKTPSFKKEEVEEAKRQKELMLKVSEKMPDAVGEKRVEELLYGQGHPYSFQLEKKDLSLVTEEKLKATFQQIAWQKGIVVLTGAVERAMVEAVKKEFEKLPTKKIAPLSFPHPNPEKGQEAEIILKDHPQSNLTLCARTISAHHPDYYALILLCELLGGSYLGSLLMQNIREKKGNTYGISCRIQRGKHDVVIVIRSSVAKGKAKETEEAIWEQIEAVKKEPITKKTLELLKKHYQGQLHALVDNKLTLAQALANMYMRGEARFDRYHDLYAKTETITAAELQSVAEKHLHRDQFARVVINP